MSFKLAAFLASTVVAAGQGYGQARPLSHPSAERKKFQQEWFYKPRALPDGSFPLHARELGIQTMKRLPTSPLQRRRANSFWPASGALPSQIITSSWTFPVAPPLKESSPPIYGFGDTGIRINAIAVHPANPNTVYLGTSFGGVAKSTDGGSTWNYVTDNLPSQAISSIVVDPVDPRIIYAGTGDPYYAGNGVSLFGVGLYRSVDSGANWQQLASSSLGGAVIRQLAIDPTTAGSQTGTTLYAAVSAGSNPGIWKSVNSGQTWTILKSGTAFDIAVDPTNQNTLYAVLASGVQKSIDAGTTWSKIQDNTAATKGRISMFGSTVFVSLCDTASVTFNTTGKLFKTTDGGTSWTQLSGADGLVGGQCDFDHYVAVDPTNANRIFLGGIDAFRSIDGGTNFTNYAPFTPPSMIMHSDHHAFAFAPSNATIIYEGNDGGIYKSTDSGISWQNKNANLPGALIIGISVSGDGHMAMGAQDNGTLQYAGGATRWTQWKGGDGGYAKIDAGNSLKMYGTYVVGSAGVAERLVARTDDGGNIFNVTDITPQGALGENSLFYPAFFMKPEDSSRLILGFRHVWRSVNSGGSWTQIGTLTSNIGISAVYEAPSDTNVIYAARASNNLWKTINASAGGSAVWTEVDTGLPTDQLPTAIVVHPTDPNTAYATFSQYGTAAAPKSHVYKTTDGGISWSNISAGLPDVPFNDIVIDTASPNNLFAASDVGLFNSIDGGLTWAQSNVGMPAGEIVNALALNGGTRQLVAGTYGRGAYSLTLPQVPPAPVGLGGTAQGTSSITWTWSASPAQYQVQAYGLYQAATPTVLVASMTSPTYIWTGLQPNTTYTLQATAANGILESVNSTSTAVSTLAAAPTPVSFTNQTATGFTVNFTNGGNGTGTLFLAQISTDSTASFSPIAASSRTANTSAAFTGLLPNQQYFFRAGAIDNAGGVVFSANSSALNISTYTAPTVPAVSSPSADNVAIDSLRFHWSAGSNAAGVTFTAQTSTDPFFGGTVKTVTGTANTYADFSGLNPNTTYYLQVQSIGQNGSSAFVDLGSTSTLAAPVASPAAGAVYLSSISFTWTANNNGPQTLFVAQISTDPTSAFYPIVASSQTANTSAIFSGLSANTTYFVRLTALNHIGVPSAVVSYASATLTSPPGAVANPLTVFSSSITASWVALSAASQTATCEGYRLDASTAADFSGTLTSSQTANSASTQLTLTGLFGSTTYYLRVGALNWNAAADYLVLGSTLTRPASNVSSVVADGQLTLALPSLVSPLTSATVVIPAHALPAGTVVNVNANITTDLSSAKSNEAVITALSAAAGIDITAQGFQPSQPVVIQMSYDPNVLPPGADAAKIVVASFVNNDQWSLLPTQADTRAHTLTVQTPHFTLFAPFLVAAGTTLNSVQMFPNPWEPGSGDSALDALDVTFSNLPPSSTVKLYTLLGELVWEATAGPNGVLLWDGTNKHGARVGSGTYVALVTGGGSRLVRRVVIIR